MVSTRKKRNNNINVLHLGILLVFLSLTTVSGYLLTRYLKVINENSDAFTQPENVATSTESVNFQKTPWETYINNDFDYELKHPKLLYKREFTGSGGYLHFVRFEENTFSAGKGMAIGVKEADVEKEVELIKAEFVNNGEIDLSKEYETEVDGQKAIYLEFTPQNEGLEARTIILIENNEKVYSLSTVPEQAEQMMSGFKFI